METYTKEIKLITNKPGETNGKKWVRYEFEFTDGFKVSTFDANIGDQFKPGQIVTIQGEKTAQGFFQMKEMSLAGNITPTPERVEKAVVAYFDRDKSIIAQTMVKAWVECGKTTEEVWDAYQFFLNKQK